jgi:tetratricopeptide (TPR) repeat protein
MPKRGRWAVLFISILLSVATTPAKAAKPDVWLEVHSPHFAVISDAGDKQARRVAYRFEQIRLVFHETFPRMSVDPNAPIIVLAVKNTKTFKDLGPPEWNKKGELERSGMFLFTPEKNYVLLDLSAPEDEPYHILFHEYTHLLIHQNEGHIPLWLDEGLAEFYGFSQIHSKEVWLGVANAGHVDLLRRAPPIPLDVLFTVGYNSPYYNEREKGNMFYAESWALTHYLMMKDFTGNKNLISTYLNLVLEGKDSVAAAQQVFGDLGALQKDLAEYVRGSSFHFLRLRASAKVDEDSFHSQALSPAESDQARGDFLIYDRRFDEARALLNEAMQLDPTSAAAAESMGFLEFQQNRNEEAEKWFDKAVSLNSKNYLANYYYAVMAMQADPLHAASIPRVEQSLETAIQINPSFAPAYASLANVYAIRGENLSHAHTLALQAVTLDPSNVQYYLIAASILLRMNDPSNAVLVCQKAALLAKTATEFNAVQRELESAEQFRDALDRQKQAEQEMLAARRAEAQAAAAQSVPSSSTAEDPDLQPPVLMHRPENQGPRDESEGVIKSVTCSSPAVLDMVFQTHHQILLLHSDNYFQVEYRALNFTPRGELNPCQQISGMKARAVFYDVKGHAEKGILISVDLMK